MDGDLVKTIETETGPTKVYVRKHKTDAERQTDKAQIYATLAKVAIANEQRRQDAER